MYVTAVVSNLTGDQWKREIVIGDGNSYHYDGIIYYNAPLIKGNTYYSFVRAYGNKAVSLPIGFIANCYSINFVLQNHYASSGLSDHISKFIILTVF